MKKLFIWLAAPFLLLASYAVAQNVSNYMEQGGARWVIGGSVDVVSGGEMDVESGGTLTVSSGSTFTIETTPTFEGDVTLDDGATDSPSLTFKDENNETAAFLKTDTGYLGLTTDSGDGLNILVGNLKVGDGSPQVTQDGEDFYVEGLTEFGGDVSLDDGATDSPSIILKDQTGETAVLLKLDSGYATFTTVAADGLNILTGNLKVGNGTPTSTPNGDDLYVTDDVEIDGSLTVDEDITVTSDPTGGNAGARSEIIGLPKLRMVSFGTGTDGQTETVALFSDAPATECATINQTAANDNSIVRAGTNSLKITFGPTPTAGDGADCTFDGGVDNFETNESIGFWFRTDTVTSSGDVYLELDDDGGPDITFDLPAVTDVDVWQWIELDISTCATCDVVDGVKIMLDSDGATTFVGGGNIWFDLMYKWDAADEAAIGQDIVQDGVIGVMSIVTATANDRTPVLEVENTDYLIHYESGPDFLVWMAAHAANSLWGTVAIQ